MKFGFKEPVENPRHVTVLCPLLNYENINIEPPGFRDEHNHHVSLLSVNYHAKRVLMRHPRIIILPGSLVV